MANAKKIINIFISETASNDVYNNACFLLLPFLTSSVPLKDKKKTTWKPSKTEVRDGFITQIATSADLKPAIETRITKLHRFGKSMQPFIVFAGTSISEISECYVVAGDTYYRFDKLLTAVDVCFKIVHATGAKYQEESFVVWMVIQKAFYRLQTEHDKELTTVNSLLVDLGVK